MSHGGGNKYDKEDKYKKMFIGGLSYETQDETLKAYFEQWGDIKDCVVMKDPNTRRSRGFGFVTYSDPDFLDKAQENRPHTIDGRTVETKRAMPREGGDSSMSVTKMFVGGIVEGTTDEQVTEAFSPYGEIEKVERIKDKETGKSKKFCFVTFTDYDSVDKAVLDGSVTLNGKAVEVKKALPKDGGGRGGGSAGRGGGGRGGGRGGGNFGGGGGYQGGGYGDYGNQGGYGGGPGGWSQNSYDGGYGNQGNWNSGNSFGQSYGDSYGGGPMRGGGGGGGGGYGNQRQGPYGGGRGGGGRRY